MATDKRPGSYSITSSNIPDGPSATQMVVVVGRLPAVKAGKSEEELKTLADEARADTLMKAGINPDWPSSSILVATLAKLKKSEDRRIFNGAIHDLTTKDALLNLVVQTLAQLK